MLRSPLVIDSPFVKIKVEKALDYLSSSSRLKIPFVTHRSFVRIKVTMLLGRKQFLRKD